MEKYFVEKVLSSCLENIFLFPQCLLHHNFIKENPPIFLFLKNICPNFNNKLS